MNVYKFVLRSIKKSLIIWSITLVCTFYFLIIGVYPMFADGANEKGLGCAALNFPQYASYEEKIVDGMNNLGPHDIILWSLANFETVAEVKEAMKNVNIVNKPFNENTYLVPLHWIFTDKNGESIVVEKTSEGLKIFDNKLGILSNSPTFDWHMTNLRQYIGLTPKQRNSTTWSDEVLNPLGQGTGLIGIPGDSTPASRFVRTAFLKSHMIPLKDESSAINEFFHILSNVSMVNGSVITPHGLNDITTYKSTINLDTGVYYYNTYSNSRLNSINMHKEDLNSDRLIIFPYLDALDINSQN